jgi:iron complex outermembrane receptor protein
VRAGRVNLYQDLQSTVPSFNWSARPGAGTASGVQTGALRGLNPDQDLVLVNGLRWHHTASINVGGNLYNGSAPVDLAFIPGSGLDRVEVLREGAAAQYGSDAISGVINMMLKDSPGGSLSVQYGRNEDRNDGRLVVIRGDASLIRTDSASLNVFAEAKDQGVSNRAIPISSNISLYRPLANGQPDPRELTRNRLIYGAYGQNPTRQLTFGFNSKYRLNNIELYAFGIFNRRDTNIQYPLVFPNNVAALPEVYPEGIYPLFRLKELDGQIAVGARGAFRGWDWNLSTTAGENRGGQFMYNDINASLGPTSPHDFHLGTLISKEWTTSLDATRKFDLANAGTVQTSFGLQDRVETFETEAGDPASYAVGSYVIPPGQLFAGAQPTPGAFYTPGFRPQDSGSWTRNVFGAYAQVGYEPTDKLLVEVAGRYERYDDTSGDSLVGKIDGRYKVTDWLAVRGSFGNGFRAPSLAQQHYSNAKATFSAAAANLNQLITTQTLPVNSPAAVALGAVPLTPEKSIDASMGFTVTPKAGLNFTVDAYDVAVNHRIALTNIIQGSAVNAILLANGLAPNLSAQYFTNAIDTDTKGVDVIGSYRWRTATAGDFRFTAAFNYNDTRITHVISNPSALSSLGPSYILFDRVAQGYLTKGIPKTKLALSENWRYGDFEFNIQEVYYGKFSVLGTTTSLDRTFSGAWIVNPSIKYNFTRNVNFVVGADNIFNHYPPATAIFVPAQGYNQYPRTSPYGWTGASYYARLQVTF